MGLELLLDMMHDILRATTVKGIDTSYRRDSKLREQIDQYPTDRTTLVTESLQGDCVALLNYVFSY